MSKDTARAIPPIEYTAGSSGAYIVNMLPSEVPRNKELKNLYLKKFLLLILSLDEIIF
tara:strand:+ start:54 stop:227 length:174 start_codon:yes stop_codon:yes gene_type:complete